MFLPENKRLDVEMKGQRRLRKRVAAVTERERGGSIIERVEVKMKRMTEKSARPGEGE